MANFIPTVQQDQAIRCMSDMVIVASPGSGKTSVLSQKIRNLLPIVESYQGVIAISFTNKASDELELRCKSDAFNVKNSFFGTIDEFCLREIIFPFVRQLMPLANPIKTVKISELPHALVNIMPGMPLHQATTADIDTFLPFLQASIAQGYVPLQAIGMLANLIVVHSTACQNYIIAKYRAVFIDEYQDSGYFQHELFLKLKALGLNAVAVGDEDQSIYAFAHKDPKHLIQLTAPGSGFSHFAITTNFRSHPSINDYAQRLINPNHVIAPTQDFRVFLKNVDGNQHMIGNWLTTAIPYLMSVYQVQSASKVAILCRHQRSARIIADHLKIDYCLIEDSPFELALSSEAGVFSDLLRLRFDPQLTAESLIDRIGSRNLKRHERTVLRRTLLQCRTCSQSNLVTSVLNAATYLLEQPVSRNGATELSSVCGNPSKLSLFHKACKDAVQIMTLHKSKGLEFDIVFHADLYDHVIPTRLYSSGIWGQVVFENERQCLNLHYVGITRAIKAAVLITSTSRFNGKGEIKPGAPSQFIGRNGVSATPIIW